VLTSQKIYDLFYDDYELGKSFLHSHTHTGNALGVSAALAMFEVMDQENIYSRLKILEENLIHSLCEVLNQTGLLENLRGIGGIVAADLINPKKIRRLGFEVHKKAISEGALIRPIGDSIYWLLPLNTDLSTIKKLEGITQRALLAV
jgi:adenosylmethionine-8-amino-7-oxononanoate aminotransferase